MITTLQILLVSVWVYLATATLSKSITNKGWNQATRITILITVFVLLFVFQLEYHIHVK